MCGASAKTVDAITSSTVSQTSWCGPECRAVDIVSAIIYYPYYCAALSENTKIHKINEVSLFFGSLSQPTILNIANPNRYIDDVSSPSARTHFTMKFSC